MKKTLKILAIISASLLFLVITALSYYLIVTFGYNLDENKLVDLDRGIIFYDSDEKIIEEDSGGIAVTDADELPDYLLKAFIAIEDKRFYSHSGTDFRALTRATLNNIKSLSFKEGASTISQQLIKNTHLTAEKTFKRKLIEIKLAKQLEKKHNKKDILEKYLNTIYFGNGNYGITKAAKAYFGKKPIDLSITEAAALAGSVKAPSVYSPLSDEEKCNARKNLVLKEMLKQKFISETDYEKCKSEKVVATKQENVSYDYLYQTKKELTEFIDKAAYKAKKFNVYTSLNRDVQNYLVKTIQKRNDRNEAAIILNKDGQIIAYASTTREYRRNLGSTIKPLLVYAPAIEEGTVYSCTKIIDEKIDFGGYKPSNYNDKYYGKTTVKESLAKSLNSCAVKILNETGIKKSLEYLSETGIKTTENDNSLAVALGCTEKGATLKEIVNAYQTFVGEGIRKESCYVNKITDENGKVLLKNGDKEKKVFDAGTANVINDALNYCTEKGTAKKLSFTKIPLCAKTGTVGNEKGNSDAYSISYNNEFIVGVWFGSKENELMPNEISGGTAPTEYACSVWEKIYEDGVIPELNFIKGTRKILIDAINYDKNDRILIADENAPKRYVKEEIFSEKQTPNEKSTIFTCPTVEKPILSINNNEISIELCQTEYLETRIIKQETTNNAASIIIYDSYLNKKNKTVKDVVDYGKTYSYYAIPYFKNGEKEIYGKEIFIDTVKTPEKQNENNTNWWNDEFD